MASSSALALWTPLPSWFLTACCRDRAAAHGEGSRITESQSVGLGDGTGGRSPGAGLGQATPTWLRPSLWHGPWPASGLLFHCSLVGLRLWPPPWPVPEPHSLPHSGSEMTLCVGCSMHDLTEGAIAAFGVTTGWVWPTRKGQILQTVPQPPPPLRHAQACLHLP